MITLGDNVALIILQFSFTNSGILPQFVRNTSPEAECTRSKRKNGIGGDLKITPTHNCSLAGFWEQLEEADYVLVDAFRKKRIDGKDVFSRRKYFTVRFIFAPRETVQNLNGKMAEICERSREFCEADMWRMRIFLNPYFEEGELVEGSKTISINMEARTALHRPDGQPVTVWQKNEQGERVGDAPIPLRPRHWLRISNGHIMLADSE